MAFTQAKKEVLQTELRRIFQKEPTVNGTSPGSQGADSVHVHVESIDGESLLDLAELARQVGPEFFRSKRSGTGLKVGFVSVA